MTEEAKTSLSTADVIEIMKLLPHRYPFLMVDKIIEIDSDIFRDRYQERHGERAAVYWPFSGIADHAEAFC